MKKPKMSKSKGNVLDPLIYTISLEDLSAKRTSSHAASYARGFKSPQKLFPSGIEAHGTDALGSPYYIYVRMVEILSSI